MSIVRSLLLVTASAVVGLSSQPVPRSASHALEHAAPHRGAEASSAARPWRARCARSEFERTTLGPNVDVERVEPQLEDGERASRTARTDEDAPRLAKADELLRTLRDAPQPGLRALAEAGEPFLELLPLDALRDVRRTDRELVLTFDTGAEDGLVVTVPGRSEHVLDADEDDPDPLRNGRAVLLRGDEHRLRIGRELRFRLDEHGIASVRAGDLEVVKGPFDVDLDLRTEARRSDAHDRYGRPVLATDAQGRPLRVDGRWQVESHATWIVLEALGHRVEVGL